MDDIILISGGFDPVHSGHIELFKNAKQIDPDIPLCVGLNSDDWLERKKGKYFMPFDERKIVIEELKSVDLVIPFNDADDSACDAIDIALQVYDFVTFANGGDRKEGGVPEDVLEEELGVRMIYNAGGDKVQSSSNLIKKAEVFSEK